ncbi:MAG: hypothetical protein LBG11_10895 [Bifidobacteriaceae bacterium]|nr:hypothetical protein [Bifidobacteriaceae bacterium]
MALIAAATVCAVVAAVYSMAGVAGANWSDSVTQPDTTIKFAPADVQLVTIDGSGQHLVDQVTANDKVLSIPFGPTEAEEVRQLSQNDLNAKGNGEVYWVKVFRVMGIAEGTLGFGYSGQVPSAIGGQYSAELVLFPVADAFECDSDAVSQNWGNYPGQSASSPDLTVAEAISAGYGTDKRFDQYYCLATRFTPGTIENTATVTASGGGKTVEATDTWSAYSLPTAVNYPTVSFDLTVNFFGPK